VTERGVKCHAYVTRIACDRDANSEEFENDLARVRSPDPRSRRDPAAAHHLKGPAMIPLDSSNLTGYDYDPGAQALTVEFKKGQQWRYAAVPAEVANGLGEADSAGRYFATEIRGKYQGEALGKPQE
jgi:hypothetical protein